jgi:hypothetical protein
MREIRAGGGRFIDEIRQHEARASHADVGV